MNDIFNNYTKFSIVYVDEVLIFSNPIKEHFQHKKNFQKIIKENGLVISASKIKLFHTQIRFLGFEIYKGNIKPIQRAIAFANKFPNEIKDKNQLQRFLRSLNYVFDFYPNLRTYIKNPCSSISRKTLNHGWKIILKLLDKSKLKLRSSLV